MSDYYVREAANLVAHIKVSLGMPEAIHLDTTFVDDTEIANLHVRYMGLPGPTDVLSFPALDMSNGSIDPEALKDEPTLGDIVICPDFIKRTGGDASSEVNIETCVIHGFLHLLGYDHQTAADAKKMFEKEEALMLSWQKSK
jgi:probable rRNA maturation factor